MIDPEELEALASQVEAETASWSGETLVDADAARRRTERLNDAVQALRDAAHETRKALGLA